MIKYKQCQFNITNEELARLNEICDKYNYRQAEAIVFAVNSYINGELEEKLYEITENTGFTKKIINIEQKTYENFMLEADFRCRTLVSLIRYSINALYEKEFLL
ncbi:MAG: hypothetical protein E7359_02085 [Clostridiales bacterium]|nr:hypothetical protein [Clostridiales bacterium]